MRLAIVVLVHRRFEQVLRCLESLAGQIAPAQDRVIVVDNGSRDDTPLRLASEIERRGWSWVTLIERENNDGFAAGANAGLRAALAAVDPPAFVLLLNDDTVVRPGALAGLLEAVEQDPRIAIAGTGLSDPEGRAEGRAFRFPGIASELERALRSRLSARVLSRWIAAPTPQRVKMRADWVAGTAMLVRREALAAIGLLDERYFLYFDDVDFCWRARRAGFEVWFLPQIEVVHWRGQTTGVRNETWSRQRLPAYWFRSRRHYFEKSYGWWYASLTDAAVVAGVLLRRAALLGKTEGEPPHYLRDLVRHGFFPSNERSTSAMPDTPSQLPEPRLPTVCIENVAIHAVTTPYCIATIVHELRSGRGGWLLSLNTQHLHLCARDPGYAARCRNATLAVADGMPLVWASRLQRTPLPERVAGADLVTLVAAEAARHGFTLFLLGGAPGVAERAAVRLQQSFPPLRLAGTHSPPLDFEHVAGERERALDAVTAARPDLVFVALGKPKADLLIDELRQRLPQTWFLGVGIGLSFLTGDVRRAPLWMRRAGLEWIHRLAQEPRRLMRRYLFEGVPFTARLLARAWALGRERKSASPTGRGAG